MSNTMKDHTTTTTTTGAAVLSSSDATNSHHSNDHRQLVPKFSLPCQLRGLIVRGMLIDTSKGSLITFGIGISLIVICWALLGAGSDRTSSLSKWWYDKSYLVGQVCRPYVILRYRNYYSISKHQ